MRIVIYVIYVHNDVNVFAYEYANLYVDRDVSVSADRYTIMIIVIVYVYMHELQNEN